jgi:NADPH-dependent curcumin reductase CurA
MNVNRCIVLRSRPVGAPKPSNFAVIEQPIPVPTAGSVLVRVLECSLDPAMRRWMDADNNTAAPPAGPRNLWNLVAKTATMTGFLNREYLAHPTEELRQLRSWIEAGRLKWLEHIDDGLENFYRAFMRLFDGTNDGKVILRIAEDE